MIKMLLKMILIVLLGIVLVAGCSQKTSITPYYNEYQGLFYTNDLARAQEQIPFTIVLPNYIPSQIKDAIPAHIRGPLREFQINNKAQVDILYILSAGRSTPAYIEITESNYVTPPEPLLNPDYPYVEIRGVSVIKFEGQFPQGSGTMFYFSLNNVYYMVGVFNLDPQEPTKVIESMIK